MAASERVLRSVLTQLRPRPPDYCSHTVPSCAASPPVGDAPRIDWPIAPLVHDRDRDPPGAQALGLTPQEVRFFKRHGYLIKRGVVKVAELAPFVEEFWQTVVPPCVDRSDPSSWVDPGTRDGWGPSPQHAAQTQAAGQVVRPWPVGYGEANIEWTEIGGKPEFVDATSAHPDTLRVVEALIGGPLKRPHRNRGVKTCVPSTCCSSAARPKAQNNERACRRHFPRADVVASTLGPHNDSMPAELFGSIYLCDVPAHSGGTTIWPGSPQMLYECFETEHQCGFTPNESYQAKFARIIQTVQPVEFVGSAGDVMFMHPAMIHSAGVNSAEHGSGGPRLATIMEWQCARPPGKRVLWWQRPGDRAGGRARADGTFAPAADGRTPDEQASDRVEVMWNMDAAEYMPYRPRPPDMWSRWSFSAKAPTVANVVIEQPWWERHGISIPHTIYQLQDIATLDRDAGLWRLK